MKSKLFELKHKSRTIGKFIEVKNLSKTKYRSNYINSWNTNFEFCTSKISKHYFSPSIVTALGFVPNILNWVHFISCNSKWKSTKDKLRTYVFHITYNSVPVPSTKTIPKIYTYVLKYVRFYVFKYVHNHINHAQPMEN